MTHGRLAQGHPVTLPDVDLWAGRLVWSHLSPARADRYRKEMTELTAALQSSVGLSGRSRVFPGNEERARTAVRKALMRAVETIESVEPQLGEHLRSSLLTGITCRYSPAPEWNITAQPYG